MLRRFRQHRIKLFDHDVADQCARISDQHGSDRQKTDQYVAAINDEDVIGHGWQLAVATQVAQHHIDRDTTTDGDGVRIHQATRGVLGV